MKPAAGEEQGAGIFFTARGLKAGMKTLIIWGKRKNPVTRTGFFLFGAP